MDVALVLRKILLEKVKTVGQRGREVYCLLGVLALLLWVSSEVGGIVLI